MAHGDYTGQVKQRLAHQFAEQQALASQSMSLVTDVVREEQKQVIDLFTDKDHEFLEWAKRENVGEDGHIEVGDSDLVKQFEPVRFRASEDLEDITVGQDRHLTLKGGRTYQVPRWVAIHLDDKGLVWH